MEFANTAVALRGDASPLIVDLANYAARDGDGRWFTHAARSAELHVWNPSGDFIRTIGRPGAGPGEFAQGGKYIGFDSLGLVYVADNNSRWSVFARDLAFVGHVNATGTGVAMGGSGFILGDGRLLSSSASDARRRGAAFGLFDPLVSRDPGSGTPRPVNAARLVRAFGSSHPGTAPVVTLAAGDSFWTGHRSASVNGYELQLWTVDGVHIRTILRNVAWLPRLPVSVDSRSNRSGTAGVGAPPPELEILHHDGTGIVVVGWMVPVPDAVKWRALAGITDLVRRRAQREELISIYVEAIDTQAGMVLASIGPLRPSAAASSLPAGFLPRSRMGYRREDTRNGTQTVQIVEMRVTARR